MKKSKIALRCLFSMLILSVIAFFLVTADMAKDIGLIAVFLRVLGGFVVCVLALTGLVVSGRG